MKKCRTIFLLFALIAFSAISVSQASQKSKSSTFECKYGQCTATASSTGKRCKNCVGQYESYCSQHK